MEGTKVTPLEEVGQNPALDPKLDYVRSVSPEEYRIQFSPDLSCVAEGVCSVELWVLPSRNTCTVRCYSLGTLGCFDAVARAAAFIRSMNLNIDFESR
jgi:hypothetical protein